MILILGLYISECFEGYPSNAYYFLIFGKIFKKMITIPYSDLCIITKLVLTHLGTLYSNELM